MANDVPITGSIRPIPQQPTLGAIARALAAANEFAARPFGYNNPPGAMLSELVGIPALQRTVQDLSYGFPVTTGAGGLGGTTRLNQDALESAITVAPLARVAGREVNRAAMKAGDVAVQAITRNPQATAMGVLQEAGQMAPLASVIKPKGGNWLAGRVEGAVEPLKKKGFTPEQVLEHEARPVPIMMARELMLEPSDTAINSWLDKKLTNYIRNEMATPEDPLRLQADEFAGRKAKLLAEKDKQLEKATADLERAQAERGVPPEVLTRSQARIRELKRERDYIEAQTGLHFMPEQAQGVGPRNRMEAEKVLRRAGASDEQNVARAYAESDVAKAWENTSDATVNPAAAGDYLNLARSSGYDLMMQKNPWLAKVPPETPVYEPVISHYRDELGFGHLADELRNAMNPASGLPEKLLLTPEKLQKMSVAQAVKHVDDINAWRAVQEREANAARAANAATSVVKEYPEQGMRWVELKLPDEIPGEEMTGALGETYRNLSPEAQAAVREDFMKNRGRAALEDALKYEGEMLSHCVGGYCNEVLSGRSRIMSLRDAEGRPRVTVELQPARQSKHPLYSQYMDEVVKPGGEYAEQYIDKTLRRHPRGDYTQETVLSDKIDADFPKWLESTHPERLAELKSLPPPVIQIKTKGNKLAAEEDIPYVLDFLNSQPFDYVNDLPRGIIDIKEYSGSLADTAQELFNKRFLTKQEMDKARRLDKKRKDQTPGFSKGGVVKSLVEAVEKYLGKETAETVAKQAPKEQKMLMGVYRGYAGEDPGEVVYHAGAEFKRPNPGLFTNPERGVVEDFQRAMGAPKLHTFEARPRRLGNDQDVYDTARRLGIYNPGVPASQYLEQGENAIFAEAPMIVEELRNQGLDALRLKDGMGKQPSLVALDPVVLRPAEKVFGTPQRRVADYYAQKRAAQTGEAPHVEMLLVDPFAGRQYGHGTMGSGKNPPMVTRARELKPEDVKSRTKLYAEGGAVDGEGDDQRGVDRMVQMEQGGAVQFNPDEIAQLASQFTSQFTPGYGKGGVVVDVAETLMEALRKSLNRAPAEASRAAEMRSMKEAMEKTERKTAEAADVRKIDRLATPEVYTGTDWPETFYRGVRSERPLNEVSSLVMPQRGTEAMTRNKNNPRGTVWAASNPLTASSYARGENAMVVPLQLTQKPDVVFNAEGSPWLHFFSQTGGFKGGSHDYPLRTEFKDMLRDPAVRSILVKDIYDSPVGWDVSLRELAEMYGLDLKPEHFLSDNLLIKDPSVVRYKLTGETPKMTEPVKRPKKDNPGYAAGGAVKYDPSEIEQLVAQMREEFHA